METAPLKSFATWARTGLIREVAARVAVVLAPASPERVEQRRAVEALEKAVDAAGGGESGKTAVADRVAYTWFNRIIALRFMDANGYTGIGVVSPQSGIESGQPEILAEAKRGNIDVTVIGTKTRETVTGLLNGTRRSEDPQGEAYALLLADYCRYWNRAMPFMFEREGDFTELLIPANLLADDSVLNRGVKVLTTDVCRDVEVIGWLYQFYISERKDEVFAGFKKNKKAGAAEIPAATQLFTPHWIVRYLVENSLGRLWMLNRPSSRLAERMEYYIAPVDEETDFLKISSPEELKVIDPACGSGHMLTYAFDLLYAIYEEEGYAPAEIPGLILTNNLYGVEIDPRAGALAAFALSMKARARQRTFFNKQVEPNVCALEPIHFTPQELDLLLSPSVDRHEEIAFWNQFARADLYGSLIRPDASLIGTLRAHVEVVGVEADLLASDVVRRAKQVLRQAEALSPEYAVVVTNPPYMGSKNMTGDLADWSKVHWPTSRFDFFAMFMERGMQLCSPQGCVAMITMQSWMFLSTFEPLRESILSRKTVRLLAHLGPSAFEGLSGEVVSTTAFVISNVHVPNAVGDYIRLVDFVAASAKRAGYLSALTDPDCTYRFRVATDDFASLPGKPVAYWIDVPLRESFATPLLGRLVITEGQNKTANNDRYLRRSWEVSRSALGEDARWIPYAKGGPFRRWYGNVEYVVDWSRSAREEYRRNASCRIVDERFWYLPGITWTDISTSGSGFRWLPEGGTFDMSGPVVFLSDGTRYLNVLGVLNSGFSWKALGFLNPTSHIQLKDVKNVPVSDRLLHDKELAELVGANVAWSKGDWDKLEISMGYAGSPLTSTGVSLLRNAVDDEVERIFQGSEEVIAREARIDELVSAEYGILEYRPSYASPRALVNNIEYRVGKVLNRDDAFFVRRLLVEDLVSYAVGCLFGRYSLDEPGFMLADQGATLQDFLSRVANPTFMPDADNVIPIVDGDWFEDDIVARFRAFLRVAFGEQHFEENLHFVTESLGVKDIRDYFVKSFYKDHVQRYKKRPIYWLFCSPKGSFSALIYMHRYTPSTVSTVLNEYLREFTAKLTSSLQRQERLAAGGGTPRQQAAAQKEADRLRKVLLELGEYEHDVLYPLASRQLSIDLDDGVKVNYPKFGAALKKIPGLAASDE
ncbi:Methyltransferase domain-containing protein [Micromonospora rhizosphaerae]|uniref:site-specific DNA-methyltransferase (adenine-specific) n=1 Tax=Micromonospora rhizosphaerae TaxID=568872 RepID=A0A1C6S978_9ACTN|nr:BREX-1 system adenine-specific DNA-methyltransferase PglX [Micromonospora rhizosphaerae]SCL26057.1 Methyltransferase domain-containing protein [Micromonospora rhizosphaerae]